MAALRRCDEWSVRHHGTVIGLVLGTVLGIIIGKFLL